MLVAPGIFALVNVSDFSGVPSIVMRFNGKDPALGPGADTFMGYECRFVQPGGRSPTLVAGIGYHNHMYTDLKDVTTNIPVPKHAGEAVALRVEIRQGTKSGPVTFKMLLNGVAVLTFTDTDQTRVTAVDGAEIALRAFTGKATFKDLKFGSL